jgi:exodeoxyribonuclease-5
VDLSPDQQESFDAIRAFIERPFPERPYFVLHGLAGTGKTYILAAVARRYPGMRVAAFTGKACEVLRHRINSPVTTIHSAIYDFKGLVEDEYEPREMNPIFVPKDIKLPGHVILVDESSMVSEAIASDLLDTGARVVACGDPGQLPPVNGVQFFVDPDSTLREVHRQAWDSPIIRQAHRIRTAGTYAGDGGGFRVIHRATPDDLLAADVLLCWRNRTRIRLNARKRELLGITGPLRSGEPVMCLKNDHRIGLFNGAIYDLAADVDGVMIALKTDLGVIAVEKSTIEGHDPAFDERRNDDDYLPFAPAYASTVHKAQGSEFENVLVIDEYDRADGQRQRWLYTAVTRAKSTCTVVG